MKNTTILKHPLLLWWERLKLGNATKVFAFQDHRSGYGGGQGPNRQDVDERWFDLCELSLDEINNARDFFLPKLELITGSQEFRKNYFCNIWLNHPNPNCPPEIFGQIIECSPKNSNFGNVRLLELIIPRKIIPTAKVKVDQRFLEFDSSPMILYMSIPLLATPKDLSKLEGLDEQFINKGMKIEPQHNPEPIRQLHTHSGWERYEIPLIWIVTTDWLSTVHPDDYEGVIHNLRHLITVEKRVVINFHTDAGPVLNDEFDYILGHSPNYFYEVRNEKQLLTLVESHLINLCKKPLNYWKM